jgi:hypothetical protein
MENHTGAKRDAFDGYNRDMGFRQNAIEFIEQLSFMQERGKFDTVKVNEDDEIKVNIKFV